MRALFGLRTAMLRFWARAIEGQIPLTINSAEQTRLSEQLEAVLLCSGSYPYAAFTSTAASSPPHLAKSEIVQLMRRFVGSIGSRVSDREPR